MEHWIRKEGSNPPSEGTGGLESVQSTLVVRGAGGGESRRVGGGQGVGIQCKDLVGGCLCPAVRTHLPVEWGNSSHVASVAVETPKEQHGSTVASRGQSKSSDMVL